MCAVFFFRGTRQRKTPPHCHETDASVGSYSGEVSSLFAWRRTVRGLVFRLYHLIPRVVLLIVKEKQVPTKGS